MNLKEIISQADGTKPFMELNGKKVYDYQGAQAINQQIIVEESVGGKKPELAERPMTPDGMTYLSTRSRSLATNPNIFFVNRYRVVEIDGKKIYEIVDDYRAIKEQSTGSVYATHINVMQIAQGKKKEDIVLHGMITVTAHEFINEFKESLSPVAMMRIKKEAAKSFTPNMATQQTNDLEF